MTMSQNFFELHLPAVLAVGLWIVFGAVAALAIELIGRAGLRRNSPAPATAQPAFTATTSR